MGTDSISTKKSTSKKVAFKEEVRVETYIPTDPPGILGQSHEASEFTIRTIDEKTGLRTESVSTVDANQVSEFKRRRELDIWLYEQLSILMGLNPNKHTFLDSHPRFAELKIKWKREDLLSIFVDHIYNLFLHKANEKEKVDDYEDFLASKFADLAILKIEILEVADEFFAKNQKKIIEERIALRDPNKKSVIANVFSATRTNDIAKDEILYSRIVKSYATGSKDTEIEQNLIADAQQFLQDNEQKLSFASFVCLNFEADFKLLLDEAANAIIKEFIPQYKYSFKQTKAMKKFLKWRKIADKFQDIPADKGQWGEILRAEVAKQFSNSYSSIREIILRDIDSVYKMLEIFEPTIHKIMVDHDFTPNTLLFDIVNKRIENRLIAERESLITLGEHFDLADSLLAKKIKKIVESVIEDSFEQPMKFEESIEETPTKAIVVAQGPKLPPAPVKLELKSYSPQKVIDAIEEGARKLTFKGVDLLDSIDQIDPNKKFKNTVIYRAWRLYKIHKDELLACEETDFHNKIALLVQEAFEEELLTELSQEFIRQEAEVQSIIDALKRPIAERLALEWDAVVSPKENHFILNKDGKSLQVSLSEISSAESLLPEVQELNKALKKLNFIQESRKQLTGKGKAVTWEQRLEKLDQIFAKVEQPWNKFLRAIYALIDFLKHPRKTLEPAATPKPLITILNTCRDYTRYTQTAPSPGDAKTAAIS